MRRCEAEKHAKYDALCQEEGWPFSSTVARLMPLGSGIPVAMAASNQVWNCWSGVAGDVELLRITYREGQQAVVDHETADPGCAGG